MDVMGTFNFMNQVTGGVQGALNTAYPNSLASQMAAVGCDIHTHYWDAQRNCILSGTTLSPAQPVAASTAVYTSPATRVTTSAPTTTQPPASCPIFQENEIVRDFHTGAIFKFEGGKLREFPSTNVYESWGSPPAWRQFTYVELAGCVRGSPMTLKSTPAPTPSPTPSPTTAAPIITLPAQKTPIPTMAPLPPASSMQYPSNLVIIAHEGEWMNKGILKVVTIRGSTPSLQPFVYKDPTQVFAIDANGAIRTISGQGLFIQSASTCDGVVGGSSAVPWRFTNRSLPRSYSLETNCAVGVRRIEFNDMVHPWALLLGATNGASTGWFVVPVARVE